MVHSVLRQKVSRKSDRQFNLDKPTYATTTSCRQCVNWSVVRTAIVTVMLRAVTFICAVLDDVGSASNAVCVSYGFLNHTIKQTSFAFNHHLQMNRLRFWSTLSKENHRNKIQHRARWNCNAQLYGLFLGFSLIQAVKT
jgi:hypothetical protein